VLVVGHGAAGLSAALCASASAQVTVLERAPAAEAGGGSRWSPSYMRMQSPAAMSPDFVDAMLRESDGRADRDYFRRLAEDAPAAIAWLQGLGVQVHQPTYYLSEGPPRIQPLGGGEALLRALAAAAKPAGVEFVYEREAQSLLQEGGRVRGVSLAGGDALAADAVVLASGGFQGNGAMLTEHFGAGGDSMRPISPGSRYNTGGGIRMALDAGAKRAGDWNGMHAEPVDARSMNSAPVVLVYPYGIVVDREGRRFFDEGAGLVHETWEAFARRLQFDTPGHVAYVILDARLLDIKDYGRAIRSEVPPVQAATLAELAAKLGIPAAALEDTVRAYNSAANGDATRFDHARIDGLATAPGYAPPKSNWARPLDRPPYLAWPLVGAVAYTFGGIQTDIEAQVIGAQGPIPGLYAAGEITGHFHGTAPNAVAMLRALVYGRIAGKNAGRNSIQ
jgi:tricarballylate dehydrogenase